MNTNVLVARCLWTGATVWVNPIQTGIFWIFSDGGRGGGGGGGFVSIFVGVARGVLISTWSVGENDVIAK